MEKFEVGEEVFAFLYNWGSQPKYKAIVTKITKTGQIACETIKGNKMRFLPDGNLIGGNGRIYKMTEERKKEYAQYIYNQHCVNVCSTFDSLSTKVYKKYLGEKKFDATVLEKLKSINEQLAELLKEKP